MDGASVYVCGYMTGMACNEQQSKSLGDRHISEVHASSDEI